MTGVDLARSIRATENLSKTKLVLLVSSDQPGVAEQAKSLGFDAYLSKPVKQSQLFDCLLNLLHEQDARIAADLETTAERQIFKPQASACINKGFEDKTADDYTITRWTQE